jgi:hypothetical protein
MADEEEGSSRRSGSPSGKLSVNEGATR